MIVDISAISRSAAADDIRTSLARSFQRFRVMSEKQSAVEKFLSSDCRSLHMPMQRQSGKTTLCHILSHKYKAPVVVLNSVAARDFNDDHFIAFPDDQAWATHRKIAFGMSGCYPYVMEHFRSHVRTSGIVLWDNFSMVSKDELQCNRLLHELESIGRDIKFVLIG